MTGKALSSTLTQFCELLDVQHQAGVGDTEFTEVEKSLAEKFCASTLTITSVSVVEATGMMRLLTNSRFQGNNRTDMLAGINAVLKRSEGVGVKGTVYTHSQTMHNFHEYISPACGEVLLSKSTTLRQKTIAVVELLSDLGAVKLSEPCIGKVLSSWLLFEYQNDATGLTPHACYNMVKSLKKFIVAKRKKCPLPHYGLISEFPSNPTWHIFVQLIFSLAHHISRVDIDLLGGFVKQHMFCLNAFRLL